MDRAKVAEWLRDTDGYSILEPQFFLDLGFDPELVKRYTHKHRSGEGKYAITKNGKVVEPVGVSEFAFVNAVARLLGIEPCEMFYGRGKNFQTTVGMILAALKEAKEPTFDTLEGRRLRAAADARKKE